MFFFFFTGHGVNSLCIFFCGAAAWQQAAAAELSSALAELELAPNCRRRLNESRDIHAAGTGPARVRQRQWVLQCGQRGGHCACQCHATVAVPIQVMRPPGAIGRAHCLSLSGRGVKQRTYRCRWEGLRAACERIGSAPALVHEVLVGARPEEDVHALHVSLFACRHKRGAIQVIDEVERCATCDEEAQACALTVECCHHQRRHTVLIREIDRSAVTQEFARAGSFTIKHGEDQRRVAEAISGVNIGAPISELSDAHPCTPPT